MGAFIDLTGKIFGRLTVVCRDGVYKNGNIIWICLCECGKKKRILGHSLITGNTKSCGCLGIETKSKNGKLNIKHGYSNKTSITYQTWTAMTQRCNDPKAINYRDYGDRKIKICYRWSSKNKKGFENFLEDIGKRPSKYYYIDRIDNNKGYYKLNCRWTTSEVNSRNKRNNLSFTYNGKTQLLIEWAEEYRINYHTLWCRIYRYKWSIEKSLTFSREKNK